MYINQYRYILKKEFDEDELMQISHIALYTAIKTFNESLGFKFTTYLKVVVTRELKIHVRSMQSLCRRANLEAVSLHQTVNEDDGRYFIEFVENRSDDFETIESYYQKEFNSLVNKTLEECKEDDRIIFNFWRIGLSYNEIARQLNCTVKTVDNSIQRVKKKLRSVIDYNNAL